MISERKLKILEAIIEDFINTAQPVGSRTISKKYPLGVSSATIRNEMADLEDLGYLLQPHASSGRVPSDLGYRIYVDNMVHPQKVSAEEMNLIRGLLHKNLIEINDVIDQSSKLLADLTGLICLASVPQFKKCQLENLKLIKVSNTRVILIMVTDSGIVKSIQLAFSNSEQFVLDKIADVLLGHLKGTTIEEISVRRLAKIRDELPSYINVVDYLLPILRDTMQSIEDVEICINGKENILKIQEFLDSDRAKEVYHYVNSNSGQMEIFKKAPTDQLAIKIGLENGIEALKDCSLIYAKYYVDSSISGNLILVGPKRMEYGTVISLMEYISSTLTEIFSGINL